MSYHSLLVLLDRDPMSSVRMQVSICLAKSWGAHLTGWAPTGLVDLPTSVMGAASLTEFAGMAWELLRENADNAVRSFLRACEAADLRDVDAWVEEGDRAVGLMRQAHCADLIVLTQGEPGNASQTGLRQLVEQAVLFCARPVLLLPYAGTNPAKFNGSFETAMVAWDDSREAARAVADALPFLQKARRVHVATFREKNDEWLDSKRLARFGHWLERHGVKAEMHTEITSGHVAQDMLSRAADWQADLVVMGAYGHSRLSERVLGGATLGLLQSMTVPVLMSH